MYLAFWRFSKANIIERYCLTIAPNRCLLALGIPASSLVGHPEPVEARGKRRVWVVTLPFQPRSIAGSPPLQPVNHPRPSLHLQLRYRRR